MTHVSSLSSSSINQLFRWLFLHLGQGDQLMVKSGLYKTSFLPFSSFRRYGLRSSHSWLFVVNFNLLLEKPLFHSYINSTTSRGKINPFQFLEWVKYSFKANQLNRLINLNLNELTIM